MLFFQRPVWFDGGRVAVHFDHDYVFGETFAKRENFALAIQRDAVSIENQFIIRADGVDLDERNFFVARHALQHF